MEIPSERDDMNRPLEYDASDQNLSVAWDEKVGAFQVTSDLGTFRVEPAWHEKAQVFYTAYTEVEGLFIEAATLDEFREVILDMTPDLLRDNHIDATGQVRPMPDIPVADPVRLEQGDSRGRALA